MKSFRKAGAVAANEIKRFTRDKTAVFFTAVLPVVIILVVGTATAGFDNDRFETGVVVPDGQLARDLYTALEKHERIDAVTYDDRLSLAKAVRRGAVPAGVVIPDTYDASILAGRPTDVELVIDQARGSPAAIRAVVAEAITDEGAALQAAIFTAKHTDTAIPGALTRAKGATGQLQGVAIGVTSELVGAASEEEDSLAPGIGYQAPSNLILFVFITSLAGSALIIQSRQLRVMQRMYATPTSARSILLGEGIARFAIAGGQALFIFLVGWLFFGVEWGDPLAATVLIGVFVLVGTSIGLLFGTIFSTPDQAGSIGSMSGIAMGMLGGCMWPLEIVPAPMRALGHVFPHAWAMDAWITLIGRGGTVGDIGTELLVLTGFVAVLLPLGVWRLRRALVT